ncbi:hypothetical protein ACFL0Q_04150 [Thermodesulfobacteriota bacterium]
MRTQAAAFVVLLLLSALDAVIPVPIVGLTLLWVAIAKPPWFLALVREIYATG